jgi:putative ABC transport system permease protein
MEIESLPLGKIISITCKGIRIRIWRSLVVVSGIILAIAFLSYILCSDGFAQNASQSAGALVEKMSPEKIQELGDQRIQTYWMVGLAVLISFVGIINAMLMSVTERFREIGTMKCLGAIDSFVLKMFLIESVIEGVVGAMAGVFLGILTAYVEGIFTYGMSVWTMIPLLWVLAVAVFSFLTGVFITVIAALYPARQASKMMPVVALRAEL